MRISTIWLSEFANFTPELLARIVDESQYRQMDLFRVQPAFDIPIFATQVLDKSTINNYFEELNLVSFKEVDRRMQKSHQNIHNSYEIVTSYYDFGRPTFCFSSKQLFLNLFLSQNKKINNK